MIISYNTHPKLLISAGKLYYSCLKISGAMYKGVPICVAAKLD
jgi:hypothetical protein